MKLTFETKAISLTEAREIAQSLLHQITEISRVDLLQAADLCAYILEPRRKNTDEKPKDDES